MRALVKFTLALLILIVLVIVTGCTQRTTLTIINKSESDLTNLVASGSGFTKTIGKLAAGEQRTFAITPTGESGVGLSFRANGNHFTAEPQGYFESGQYKVTATVAPDFSVTVNTSL